MSQLEGLMKMLKNQQTTSPRSTPNSSPRSGKSPPLPSESATNYNANARSPIASVQNQLVNNLGSNQITELLITDSKSSISGPINGNALNNRIRNDLHYAADTVTCAMTTLVRELNTGNILF